MFTKRSVIVLFAGMNLFLLAMLLSSVTWLPRAMAQAGGRAGDFSCVTAKAAGQSYDAVFILDGRERKLHAFYPSGGQGKFAYAQFRDLVQDFRGQQQQP